MNFFFVLITLFLLWDLLWLVMVDRRLLALRAGNKARLANLLFFFFMVVGIVIVLYIPRALSREIQLYLPWPYLGALFLWHLVVAPIGLAVVGIDWLAELSQKLYQRKNKNRQPSQSKTSTGQDQPEAKFARPGMTRRQLLTASVLAAPPLVLAAGTTVGMAQIGTLRVRELSIPIAGLRPELEGVRIVHISDTHYGRFTNHDFTDNLVSTINKLDADLHLVTGDLIDNSLLDLDHGLNMLRRIKNPNPIFCCVGNHDLFMSRFGFIERVKASGVRLLVDEHQRVTIRGAPLDIYGADWSKNETDIANSVNYMVRNKEPDIPSVMLAHHPHAFDYAAAKGIDLTLSGHTHGGQLMLTKNLGPGPFMYRYWTGLYEKQGRHLAVSNGVGNWFPLRINAPAELLHIKLVSK